MRSLIAAYDRLLNGLGILPGVLVAVIAVGTCADVLLRNLGYSGLYGMLEIIEYSLLVLTVAGAGYVMRIGRHITVDILSEYLPPALARLMNIVATLLATVFAGVFLWFGFATTIDSYESGAMVLKSFVFPEWLLIAVIPFGFFFLTVELLRRLYLLITSPEVEGSGGTGRDGGL